MFDVEFDESGRLVAGCFFWLELQDEEVVGCDVQKSGGVQVCRRPINSDLLEKSGHEYVTARPCNEAVLEKACDRSALHITKTTWINPVVELTGGPEFSELLSAWDADHIVVVTDLVARHLRSRNYRKLDLQQCKIEGEVGSPRGEPIWVVNFLGDCCLRNRKLRPGIVNSCCFCGESPAFCDLCGFALMKCPKCIGHPVRIPRQGVELGKGIIRVPAYVDGDTIMEGHLWDGSDFISGGWRFSGRGIVTRRVIDGLASIHASPLIAVPVRIDVSRMSRSQFELLSEVSGMPVSRLQGK